MGKVGEVVRDNNLFAVIGRKIIQRRAEKGKSTGAWQPQFDTPGLNYTGAPYTRSQENTDNSRIPFRSRDYRAGDFTRLLLHGETSSQKEDRLKREAEAKLAEQRMYDERLANEERERLEKARAEDRAYLEQREDTVIQRLVRDAMAAGLSPEHVLGSASSPVVHPAQGVTTQSKTFNDEVAQDNSDLLKILSLALLVISRGRVR